MTNIWLKKAATAAFVTSIFVAVGCTAVAESNDGVAENVTPQAVDTAPQALCCTGEFYCPPPVNKVYKYHSGACTNTVNQALGACNHDCPGNCQDPGATCN